MSYKTTRVSKALLVMVAFLLPVHIFLIKLTVSTLFIPEIHISKKTWILYAKIQANRSINKPFMIFFTAHAQGIYFCKSQGLSNTAAMSDHPWKFRENRFKTQQVTPFYVFLASFSGVPTLIHWQKKLLFSQIFDKVVVFAHLIT